MLSMVDKRKKQREREREREIGLTARYISGGFSFGVLRYGCGFQVDQNTNASGIRIRGQHTPVPGLVYVEHPERIHRRIRIETAV